MAKEESGFKVIIVLVLIALVAASLLAYVNKVTEGPIAANRKAETQRAIKVVLQKPSGVHHPEEPIDLPLEAFEASYFPVKNDQERTLGYAFKVKAPNGFTSDFEILVGVDTTGKILDTYVLAHKETPGLGDGMTEEEFKKQFRGRTLESTTWKVKKDGGDIDAITAATITSRAFTTGVQRALKAYQKLKEEQQ